MFLFLSFVFSVLYKYKFSVIVKTKFWSSKQQIYCSASSASFIFMTMENPTTPNTRQTFQFMTLFVVQLPKKWTKILTNKDQCKYLFKNRKVNFIPFRKRSIWLDFTIFWFCFFFFEKAFINISKTHGITYKLSSEREREQRFAFFFWRRKNTNKHYR